MAIQHPTSYQLGRHTLECNDDGLLIENETVAIELAQEEANRLHLVLEELFGQQDQLRSKDVPYAAR